MIRVAVREDHALAPRWRGFRPTLLAAIEIVRIVRRFHLNGKRLTRR
jgi:hypothetical protein